MFSQHMSPFQTDAVLKRHAPSPVLLRHPLLRLLHHSPPLLMDQFRAAAAVMRGMICAHVRATHHQELHLQLEDSCSHLSWKNIVVKGIYIMVKNMPNQILTTISSCLHVLLLQTPKARGSNRSHNYKEAMRNINTWMIDCSALASIRKNTKRMITPSAG